MQTYKSVGIFVAFFAMITVEIVNSKKPCCAPNYITRDTFLTGKLWTSYIDFVQMRALEDWGGRDGVSYILLYLDTNTQFTRMADGTCSKSTFVNKYARCVTSDAGYYQVEPVNGVELNGWIETLEEDLHLNLVTRAVDCIAHSVVQTTPAGLQTTYHFYDTRASIDDLTVFDKDVSDCQ